MLTCLGADNVLVFPGAQVALQVSSCILSAYAPAMGCPALRQPGRKVRYEHALLNPEINYKKPHSQYKLDYNNGFLSWISGCIAMSGTEIGAFAYALAMRCAVPSLPLRCNPLN